MSPDRLDICRRHRLPEQMAAGLVGQTAAELEADAAAKASILSMFGPRALGEELTQPAEPPVEGLPPKDKPASEYSEAEWQAQHEHTRRALRERASQEQREREAGAQHLEAEANRTPEERHNAFILGAISSDKRTQHEALIRSLHPSEEER